MTLREIDIAIMELFDEETGNLLEGSEDAFGQLQIERNEKIKNTALYFKNLTAEAEVISWELKRLQNRKKVLENKARGLNFLLERALQGQNFHDPLVDVRYKKNPPRVEVMDEAAVIQWCKESGNHDCIKFKPPEISKGDIKRLLKNGVDVPGVELVSDYRLGVE